MTEDPTADRDEPIATLLSVLDEPEDGRRRLPRLVGLLDDDDRTVRLGAAWAISHVAAQLPDTAGYLTRRLTDRLADEDAALETEFALGYVAACYPDEVGVELDAIEVELRNRPRPTPIQGSLARANYHLPERGDRGVGRTRLAGEGGSAGPQRVYSDDSEAERRFDRTRDREREDDDSDHGEAGDLDDATEAEDGDADDGDVNAGTDDRSWEPADDVPTIVYRSRFDQLTVLAKRRHGRYADVYRTLGVVDGEQLPVALARFHRPPEGGEEFGVELSEQLKRWAGVCGHENVVTLYDWDVEPRPWAAAEYADQRLVDRGRFDLEEALWNASELATAVGHVHENGVVHGGIDPGNVVYHGNVLADDERQSPLLTNVGVLRAVRRHFDPTARLDPRYAAPEYFDRRFGRIDHATDIYQLGAVLYRLCTGMPPYDGEYVRIRDRILSDPPPRPGDVVTVPPGVDEVVTKAMARQKLRRYETVTHLGQELRSIYEELENDDR